MSNQATPLKVSYDAAELDAVSEARLLVSRLQHATAGCFPAWSKLDNVDTYLIRRQRELTAEALAAPEVL